MKEPSKPKIGEGHADAMGRKGLGEIRNAFYPESNVASQTPDYGVFGTKTPGEVAEDRRPDRLGLDQETPEKESIVGSRFGPVNDRDEVGRDAREIEMER